MGRRGWQSGKSLALVVGVNLRILLCVWLGKQNRVALLNRRKLGFGLVSAGRPRPGPV